MHDLSALSRRRFLSRLGGAALGGGALGRAALGGSALGSLFVAACGDEPTRAAPQVVGLFSSNRVIVAGREQRLPFGLVDPGETINDSTTLTVQVRLNGETIAEQTVAGRIVEHDHAPGTGDHEHADILRYYALRVTLPEPDIYDLMIEIDGRQLGFPVQAFDKSEVELPTTGDRFPKVETATFDNPMGVDPLCTLFDGPCPFHTRSATQVLAERQPMALLVATPAFCVTSYCGPVLETMIEASADFPSVGFVHVEPWANPTEGEGLSDPGLRRSPTIDELRLSFEPALFLVDAEGILVDRIDNVFDGIELRAGLALLT